MGCLHMEGKGWEPLRCGAGAAGPGGGGGGSSFAAASFASLELDATTSGGDVNLHADVAQLQLQSFYATCQQARDAGPQVRACVRALGLWRVVPAARQ